MHLVLNLGLDLGLLSNFRNRTEEAGALYALGRAWLKVVRFADHPDARSAGRKVL